MKKMLVGLGVAIVAWFNFASAAFADECCGIPCPCPTAYNPCCCEYFDGFYVGGNVGAIGFHAHRNDLNGFVLPGTLSGGWTHHSTAVTAGVQVGYDLQCCNKLFGLVVDWNWTDAHARTRAFDASTADEFRLRSELDWFLTIRGRAGVAINDALAYITFGAVVGDFEDRFRRSTLVDEAIVTDGFRHDHRRWGWVAGVGTEFAFCQNWGLGFELLLLHFGRESRSRTLGTVTYGFDHHDHAWVGRVLLNYRFGCGCGPF